MLPLQHISRKTIIGLTLLICYTPFCWVLFISENRLDWIKIWPVLPGLIPSTLFRFWFHIEMSKWFSILVVTVTTMIVLSALLFLMFRVVRWRFIVVLASLLLFCYFSLMAYSLYRA